MPTVPTLWCECRQRLLGIGRFVVKRIIEAKRLDVGHLFVGARRSDDAAAHELEDLTSDTANSTSGTTDEHCVATTPVCPQNKDSRLQRQGGLKPHSPVSPSTGLAMSTTGK